MATAVKEELSALIPERLEQVQKSSPARKRAAYEELLAVANHVESGIRA